MINIVRAVVIAGLFQFGVNADAFAADFPSKPITVVAATTVGGALDIVARILAPDLERLLKQPVVVENRGGAGAQIAANVVTLAPPDGHTLLISTGVALVPVFMKKPIVTLKNLAPISLVAEGPLLFAVPKDLPVNSMAELFSYVRANPGKLNYPTVGRGAALSLYYEYWKTKENLKMQEIPYPGPGPIMDALLRGDVQMAFLGVSFAKTYTDTGKGKVLAVSGKNRLKHLPNLPTFDEAGVSGIGSTMVAMHSAAGTPNDRIATIYAALLGVGKSPEFIKRMDAQNFVITMSTPEELRQREEADSKWAVDVARATNLQPE